MKAICGPIIDEKQLEDLVSWEDYYESMDEEKKYLYNVLSESDKEIFQTKATKIVKYDMNPCLSSAYNEFGEQIAAIFAGNKQQESDPTLVP